MISSPVASPRRITDDSPQFPEDSAVGAIVPLAKLLADETRVRILTMLSQQRELCVRDLWERLLQTQPAVSHHLALLRQAGLVRARHSGRNTYYRLDRRRLADLLAGIGGTPLGQLLKSVTGQRVA
jgi:ArsR family transcriptional regulator, arsenate/arsenite/antimonite-responsive transcriptional repressor